MVMLLMTDGVWEATTSDGSEFGTERAIDVVRANRHMKAIEIVNKLHDAVRAFTHDLPQDDDITIVVIKVESAKDGA